MPVVRPTDSINPQPQGRVLRVAACIWRLGLGGAERQLIALLPALRDRGIDVHVLTVFPGALDDELAATGVPMHRLAPFGKYDITVIPRLAHLLRGLQVDVVTTWLTQMDIAAGMASLFAGMPFVLCERSGRDGYPPSFLNAIRRRVGRRASAIVANSRSGQEYWTRFVDPSRVSVVPNIIPLEAISAAQPVEAADLGDSEIILYVGRFGAEKNLSLLLDAIALILPSRRATAVFCGDGPLRPAMERKAVALGIADRVLFTGAVSNVWSWMKRASLVVAVSLFEGRPNVVLEAIACDRPLVLSDIEGYRDVVGEEGALFVDPGDARSIADGLVSVLDAPDAARQRAGNARMALGGHSAGEIASQYAEVFERVRRQR